MKKLLRGTAFKMHQEDTDAADISLRQFDAKLWETGFGKLIHRYRKCIALNDEYVERTVRQTTLVTVTVIPNLYAGNELQSVILTLRFKMVITSNRVV